MEITITITNQDILLNPNIIDGVKALGLMLVEKPEGTDTPTDKRLSEESTEPKYSIEEVRKALSDLSKEKGNQAAKNILKAYKVCKVTELSQNEYSGVMDAVKKVK